MLTANTHIGTEKIEKEVATFALKSLLDSKLQIDAGSAAKKYKTFSVKKEHDEEKNEIDEHKNKFQTLSDYYIENYNNTPKAKSVHTNQTNHEMITEEALNIVNTKFRNDSEKSLLLSGCIGPDKDWGSIMLVMEGHFYGSTSHNASGNYLKKIMPAAVYFILSHLPIFEDHMKESAFSNANRYFSKYYSNDSQLEDLGWCLHFVQDMTAPHHAGNIPSFFPSLDDRINSGMDTHNEFEDFANELLDSNRNIYREKALPLLDYFRGMNLNIKNSTDFDTFLKYVNTKALENVNDTLQTRDEAKWNNTISNALPLAIAASAFLLEQA
ncbi:MAG TPA: hypothetical protein VHT34_10225 [Clostridia bacterium]|nr:hypothetical protein [Clostridia bacterium]